MRVKNDDKFSSYQIATDPSMSIDSTIEAHIVKDDVDVHLRNGEYIKLVNCTGKIIEIDWMSWPLFEKDLGAEED